jgi:calcium/calmodulin-dependent protein kinase I
MILNNLRDFPHPNIIQLEEITTNGLSLSVILEYCSGGDLLKYLNQKEF